MIAADGPLKGKDLGDHPFVVRPFIPDRGAKATPITEDTVALIWDGYEWRSPMPKTGEWRYILRGDEYVYWGERIIPGELDEASSD